jgi:hypothetical protein
MKFSRQQMRDGGYEWQMHFVDASGKRLLTVKGTNARLANKNFKDEMYTIAEAMAEAWTKRTGKMPTMT